MAIKNHTMLLLAAVLLLIAATALSINHQFIALSHLKEQYQSMEDKLLLSMRDWDAMTFERWVLRELGTYPRNATPLGLTEGIEAFIFFSDSFSEENLTSRFDLLAANFNITVTYLSLTNQTNLDTLEGICDKTGFPEPDPTQSYLIVLSSSKIICLRLDQVDNEVFSKCLEYLSL